MTYPDDVVERAARARWNHGHRTPLTDEEWDGFKADHMDAMRHALDTLPPPAGVEWRGPMRDLIGVANFVLAHKVSDSLSDQLVMAHIEAAERALCETQPPLAQPDSQGGAR